MLLSVYSELLRLTLLGEEGSSRSLPDLVRLVVTRRGELISDVAKPAPDPAGNMGSSLAYDAALVALCHRLGVPETLTGGDEVTAARREAERLLAAQLPSLQNIVVEH